MLRSSLYRRVIAIAMGASLLVALCVGVFGAFYYRKILDEERDLAFRDMEQRLAFLDRMIGATEASMLARGRSALIDLASRVDKAAGMSQEAAPSGLTAMSPEALAEKARGIGVDEIYVIDGENRIVAASLRSDLGLDLGASDEGFRSFLESLRGKGRIENQRLATAERTGTLNTYQYFSPEGSSYILEVSCELERHFPESSAGVSYRDFVALCFAPYLDPALSNPVRGFDVANCGQPTRWSLVRPGERILLSDELLAVLRTSGQAKRTEGSTTHYYRAIERVADPDSYADFTVAEVTVDYSPLVRFILLTSFFGLACCALAGLLSLFAARSFFDRSILNRIEALRAAMARAADDGGHFAEVKDGDDELAVIGRGVETMLDEVRAAEEKLRNAKAAETIGLMAGGLAHDINNLLAGTVGAASLLRSRIEDGEAMPEPEELRSTLALIERTGERGNLLVRDLLALARADRPSPERVNLAKLAAETAELVRVSCPPEVRVECELPPEPAWVRGSPEDLGRVILNLCRNATQAMTDMRAPEEKRGGILSLRFETRAHPENPGAWCLVVRDTGVGMDEEVLARLFTPFFSTKPRRGGSGLGLAASRAIIEAHGGILEVESEKGFGSEFRIVLPRDGSAA